MKETLREMIRAAAVAAFEKGVLSSSRFPDIEIDEPRSREHGDFATNMAMVSASIQKTAPRKIAEAIVTHLADPSNILLKTEIAGPGFINFFIRPEAWLPVLRRVHGEGERFGACDLGGGKKVQVEFVSANPTGPLHVGHGRGAAVGDSVARILACCGWQVQREYYVNDAGNQIMTLGRSVLLRLRELSGQAVDFPGDCYQGDYIRAIARQISADHRPAVEKMAETEAVVFCARIAADHILEGIRQDLETFGITFDRWFSEKSLVDEKAVERALERLKAEKVVYESEGALWFATSRFGDEKDRVVVRNNGEATYFASDIAYHKNKFDRGFDRVIDVWGADHHGYIPRVKAAVQAVGRSKDDLDVILVQLVALLRDGQPVAMSTRSGEFVTLKEVVDEVGPDAARFIFLSRHYDSPLDFDLELAKKKSNDNPVYYVQYVHARIASMLRKAQAEKNIDREDVDENTVERLREPEEIDLVKLLARYPEAVSSAARFLEPHRITFYLLDLAAGFHGYYSRHKVLTDDAGLTLARLYLVCAVKQVMKNGLALLGVSAPESM
ncbi:MAG: arginine--tRNA ligase [Thermodesulfobacteriota bacterium]